jgi:hypothetical protein
MPDDVEKPLRTRCVQKGVQKPHSGFQVGAMPCVCDKGGARVLTINILEKVIPAYMSCKSDPGKAE